MDNHESNIGFTKIPLSVFFPCHNEAGNIEKLVDSALDVLQKVSDDYEVIIVDDGSIDGTAVIGDRLARSNQHIKIIHHATNKGYGAALRSGIKAAKKDYVFYTDGDNQFDIGQLPEIIPLISECDIVSCYREKRSDSLRRIFNAWCWGKLVSFLFKMKIRDIDCAFKLYKREIFDNIRLCSNGALIDTEILARALKKGYTIKQLPVKHFPRTSGKQSGAKMSVVLRAFTELWNLRSRIMKEQ